MINFILGLFIGATIALVTYALVIVGDRDE